jgi:hypothetical protein
MAHLVAQHPIPLSISAITNGSVREVQVRCVVRVEALQSGVARVAELCAPYEEAPSVFLSTWWLGKAYSHRQM